MSVGSISGSNSTYQLYLQQLQQQNQSTQAQPHHHRHHHMAAGGSGQSTSAADLLNSLTASSTSPDASDGSGSTQNGTSTNLVNLLA